eukprot:1121266-Prorocentrum_minimum.AAC.1
MGSPPIESPPPYSHPSRRHGRRAPGPGGGYVVHLTRVRDCVTASRRANGRWFAGVSQGLVGEAQKLFAGCERYDLLNTLHQ